MSGCSWPLKKTSSVGAPLHRAGCEAASGGRATGEESTGDVEPFVDEVLDGLLGETEEEDEEEERDDEDEEEEWDHEDEEDQEEGEEGEEDEED